MTRKEAIERLDLCQNVCNDCLTCASHDEALDMAIAALREQETVTNRNGLTNADHIRSMTDEELRVVLEILAKSDVCLNSQSAQCDGCVFSPFCNSVRCAEDVMDWLKQPYKEEA